MLSGGKTPLPVYERLAKLGITASDNAHVLFSDEREVSPKDPQSNYGNIRPFLSSIAVPNERIMRVQAELGFLPAAKMYDYDLRTFLENGRVTLGFLGVGTDGHTASMFTMADIEKGRGHMAVPISRPEKPNRITVTQGFLEKVEVIIFLVSGPDKAEVTEKLIGSPLDIPAGRMVSHAKYVELWIG